jgi:hypothetical protein
LLVHRTASKSDVYGQAVAHVSGASESAIYSIDFHGVIGQAKFDRSIVGWDNVQPRRFGP